MSLGNNLNGSGRRIGVLNFQIIKVRKIIDNFDKVLNLSLSSSDVRDKLSDAVLKCNRSMEILRKNDSDCTSEEWFEFKCLSNSFCTTLSRIDGRKIFTNYFNLLIADHIYDHMV